MEPPIFIEYDEVTRHIAPDAVVGGLRYRQRPPDKGCLHGRVTFGSEIDGMVHVECDGCKLGWLSVIEGGA